IMLAGRMHEEGKDAVDLAANREEVRTLETVTANAAMALKDAPSKEEGTFWQRLVRAASKPLEKKPAAPRSRDTGPEVPDTYDEYEQATHAKHGATDIPYTYDDFEKATRGHEGDGHTNEISAAAREDKRRRSRGSEVEIGT
ncbi:MAG: hypothetical protein AB7F82_09970, partial [Alphaproteobacteria bacterium]